MMRVKPRALKEKRGKSTERSGTTMRECPSKGLSEVAALSTPLSALLQQYPGAWHVTWKPQRRQSRCPPPLFWRVELQEDAQKDVVARSSSDV